jgi:hypothetical protein
MKKFKLILSAVMVFAVVGSALAFKTKVHPNLFTCPNGITCQSTPLSSFAAGSEIANPGNVYITTGNLDCTPAGDCKIYTGRVWNNN